MKRFQSLGLLMTVLTLCFAFNAKAQVTADSLNGKWDHQEETQDGNMTSVETLSFTFDTADNSAKISISTDANGISGFMVFSADGSYTLEGDNLKVEWKKDSANVEFNQFALLMMGDQAKMVQSETLKGLSQMLDAMNAFKVVSVSDSNLVLSLNGEDLEFRKN